MTKGKTATRERRSTEECARTRSETSVATALYKRFEKLPKGPRMPKEDAARLGEEIYERDIEPLVIDDHDGECVCIDVETGVWAIADDLLEARLLLHEKRPDAVNVYGVRVGYVAVDGFSGAPPRKTR